MPLLATIPQNKIKRAKLSTTLPVTTMILLLGKRAHFHMGHRFSSHLKWIWLFITKVERERKKENPQGWEVE